MIIISSYTRDEKYFSNPEIFDPERFSIENKASLYPGAYFPFGLGPRRCVGMRFAQTQIKVCMMKLLSQFRVEPSENTPKQLKCEPKRMLQEPKGGLRLNLIRRH
ncbi:hypothetical protein MSG28_014008 [Choristoneura fumiferana]|uniref:Uncharacterized protein n=1 Tax=Choristoneura fumiferana TaxID=7141 RepID=A0ACC0JFQ2_CHOFU|nr:hypothetical protein MSG28_014008 [Choristoneura fumiferana]